MPGPMSAPNGDRRLLQKEVREKLARKKRLRTGKTALVRTREQRPNTK